MRAWFHALLFRRRRERLGLPLGEASGSPAGLPARLDRPGGSPDPARRAGARDLPEPPPPHPWVVADPSRPPAPGVARLLIVADTDELPPPGVIEQMVGIRLLVSLGDLADGTVAAYARRSGVRDVVSVRGNHDPAWPLALDGLVAPAVCHQALHGRVLQVAGLRIGGVDGCLVYRVGGSFRMSGGG